MPLTDLRVVLCWDRASRSLQPLFRRSHYEEVSGENLLFSVENEWQLLIMTVYFGSRFAALFNSETPTAEEIRMF